MTATSPQWSQEQTQAISLQGMSLLVSAGAGSGKTTVLVERVVKLLKDDPGLSLENFLIVTFTDAAAAEMRERIATRLNDARQQAEEEGDVTLAQRFWNEQSRIDRAQISTLHSFCLDVVRRNFFALGLEPYFSILSEEEKQLLKVEVLEALLNQHLQGPDSRRFSAMLTRFQVSAPDKLQELVFRIDEFARSQHQPQQWLQAVREPFLAATAGSIQQLVFTEAFRAWLLRMAEGALGFIRYGLPLAQQDAELAKYADNFSQVQTAIATFVSDTGAGRDIFQSGAHLATAMTLLTARNVRAKDCELKETVKAVRLRCRKQLQEAVAVLGRGEGELLADLTALRPDVDALMELVEGFQRALWQEKQKRSQVDFSDIEHLALAAMEAPETGEKLRLQERFRQVFVDEYQDTSPIQDAIVGAVERGNNLFVVGDVKQSIYRFRMAEPGLFLMKQQALQAGSRQLEHGDNETDHAVLRCAGATVGSSGRALDLAANYRSRREVVDLVNIVFGAVFSKDFGGIDYNGTVRMTFGALYPQDSDLSLISPVKQGLSRSTHEASTPVDNPSPEGAEPLSLAGPVELHLIERSPDTGNGDAQTLTEPDNEDKWEGTDVSGEGEMDGEDDNDTAEEGVDLTAAEQEALVVAQRMRELMGHNGGVRRQVYDARTRAYRPLNYRDMVVLLRSAKGRVNVFLNVFQQAGIPAYGATSTGFFSALEVQWFLSALSVIDNPRREVHLAVLMRSPLFGFRDAELSWIRLASPGHFYSAVVAAAQADTQIPDDVRNKAANFLSRLRHWRRLARKAGAYDVIKAVMDETGVLHYLLGMPGGETRQANVEALLEQARKFDRTSFDGVFGFSRRLQATLREELDTGEARTLGEQEDVVRVMTIHQSKGLEFPVVFLAGLGKLFYQSPDERKFPLHRTYGFGPQFIDSHLGRRWKTLCSIAVEEANLAGFLEEEARVLYVALTRAKERLILVGAQSHLAREVEKSLQVASRQEHPLHRATLMGARTYLDWLLPIFLQYPSANPIRQLVAAQGAAQVSCLGALEDAPLFVTLWNTPGGQPLPSLSTTLSAGGETIAVPAFRPVAGSLDELRQWLSSWYVPPGAGAPTVSKADSLFVFRSENAIPGKVTATDLRRLWTQRHTQTGRWRRRGSVERLLDNPAIAGEGAVQAVPSPRSRGIAFHAVVQHLDFTVGTSVSSVTAELQRLLDAGRISQDIFAAVDVEQIAAFLESPLGRQLARARRLFREQSFFTRLDVVAAHLNEETLAEPPTEDGRWTSENFVVVQGVIDCLAEVDGGWLLIDYKTDDVTTEEAPLQAKEYEAQVATYLQVVHQLVGGAAVAAYLYFVHPQVQVEMHEVNLQSVFVQR